LNNRRYLFGVLSLLWLLGACGTPPPSPAPFYPTFTPAPTLLNTSTPIPTRADPTSAIPTLAPSASKAEDAIAGDRENIYVRLVPNTMAGIIRTVSRLAPLTAVGRTEDGVWVQVQFEDGSMGWVLRSAIPTPDIATLPVNAAGVNVERVALVLADAPNGLYLLQQPYEGSSPLLPLYPLTPLHVNRRLDDFSWLEVNTIEGYSGWVKPTILMYNFSLSNIPAVPAPTPAPTSTLGAQVLASNINSAGAGPAQNVNPSNFVEQGRVQDSAGGLRLRQIPSSQGTVLFNLRAGTRLSIEGRTDDNAWLLVRIPEGYSGWVASTYIDLSIDLSNVASVDNPQPVPYFELPTPVGAPSVASNITVGARNIYLRGQQLGNRRAVFTKVGDSLTDTQWFLREFAGPNYNLDGYGYLLPVLNFFSTEQVVEGNSFMSTSRASRASWGAPVVLDPARADGGLCNAGETPLQCEYRRVKPAVALIMIGTNDAPAYSAAEYEGWMRQIVEISIQNGVVPVLSTLPPRAQHHDKIIAYNQVIIGLARQYDVPLWDFYSACVALPNSGLDADGVHLSAPPGGAPAAASFTADNLRYGTTLRNLTALQMLDSLWRQVLY
jgi:uncharacterized protein YgiM (DUF1202 family)